MSESLKSRGKSRADPPATEKPNKPPIGSKSSATHDVNQSADAVGRSSVSRQLHFPTKENNASGHGQESNDVTAPPKRGNQNITGQIRGYSMGRDNTQNGK